MIEVRFADVSFAYDDSLNALSDVSVTFEPGEMVVVAGASGSGKSTFLRCVNGLVPHASGGSFAGDVRVGDRSIRENPPRALADVVGFVQQDPEAHFVVDRVEADIAFVLENLGTDPAAMRRRVEEVLDALDIAALRYRSPHTLSGGEKQRCAIAAALASGPDVLVLDEPTSQLDPQGAEDVLAAIARLNADLGATVIFSEHRLERAAPLADRAVRMAAGVIEDDGLPAEVLAGYSGAPSVTRLGAVLGWDPPPLTVKEALVAARRSHALPDSGSSAVSGGAASEAGGDELLAGAGLRIELGGKTILSDIDVRVREGEVVALLGRNGSGKTTLLRTLVGLLDPSKGSVSAAGRVGYVPQDPNTMLSAHTVRHEIEATLKLLGRKDSGEVDYWLDALDLSEVAGRHPRSLSVGQRQRVAVGAVGVGAAEVLLLDEPTRGMDQPSRTALSSALRRHANVGGAAVLATHDVELAAAVATRVVVLVEGDIVADGPAADVLSGSLFAPQVLRVLPPFLTVDDVASAVRDDVRDDGVCS